MVRLLVATHPTRSAIVLVRIDRTSDGRIIFLEVGTNKAGLKHILKEHITQFADKGIVEEQIPDAVMAAVLRGNIVGYQGKKIPPRPIYQVDFNGRTQLIAVEIGSNGYIVSANPR